MKLVFISLFTVTVCISCEKAPQESKPMKPAQVTEHQVQNKYTFETLHLETGWGYTILVDDKPFIIQKSIPSMQGVKGFDSEDQASKCAEFVIQKMVNGSMPPSVTPEELKSIGIL